jgi:hypothetical protein
VTGEDLEPRDCGVTKVFEFDDTCHSDRVIVGRRLVAEPAASVPARCRRS